MSRLHCYSVRLSSLTSISEKAYKATAFDGSSAIIPKSMVMGQDYDVQKSDAYWIASFILEKEDCNLQCSFKKEAWFDRNSGRMLPTYKIEKHIPAKVEAVEVQPNSELLRENK